MATTLPPTLRKAALLIRSLDADSSAVLLGQLSDDEAQAVRRAIRDLGEVDPLEQEELRLELRTAPLEDSTPVDESGVELALSTDLDSPLNDVPRPLNQSANDADQPFGWLEGGDLPSLAAILEREHLSTVAVVLSHLPPRRASEVLSALPPVRRAAALERLADLGESDRASLEVIERELAEWIRAQKAERQRRADRLISIQAILRHSSPSTCDSVLSDIAMHDESLAREIGEVRSTARNAKPQLPSRPIGGQAATLEHRESASVTTKKSTPRSSEVVPTTAPPQFAFERLVELTDTQLVELFRNCSSDCVVLALAGASDQLTRRVESRLPKNVAKELRRRMHNLSSVRLSDFAKAQERVASVAAKVFLHRPNPSK